MTRFGCTMAILFATCVSVRSAQKPFQRVEEFPPGEQGASLGSLVKLSDLHTETITLKASYAATWVAVKRVAQKLDKVGGRPITGVNEQSGRIQNGRIRMGSLELSGKMLDFRDEFITEITALDAQTTKLSVTRKLVKKTIGSSNWQHHVSNGKVERWFITQVMDDVTNPAAAASIISQARIAESFLLKGSTTDVLDLREDQTFHLSERGRQRSGTYELAGESLTLIIGPARFAAGRVAGDTLTDTEGQLWIRKGVVPTLAGPDSGGEIVLNADIVKLVEAKLQDGIIISKIKGSACRFDLTTGALIKLKGANVSDAVIQAMTDAPRR